MGIKKAITDCLKKINPFYRLPKASHLSYIALDVVIIGGTEDTKTLSMTIDSIKKNIRHPIGKIIVVAPNGETEFFYQEKLITFVDEDTVLPIARKDIKYIKNGEDKSDWIFHQLLKLNADTLVHKKYFLVVDSGTIFTRPQTFFDTQEHMIINCSDENNDNWLEMCKKLIPLNRKYKKSFDCHHMVFYFRHLRKFKNAVKTRTGQDWWNAILYYLNKFDNLDFSVYETYGNYIASVYNRKLCFRYWYNKEVSMEEFEKMKDKTKYKTISINNNYKR